MPSVIGAIRDKWSALGGPQSFGQPLTEELARQDGDVLRRCLARLETTPINPRIKADRWYQLLSCLLNEK